MKTLKRMFMLTAVVAVFGLATSCTKQDLNEEIQQINKKELTEESV